MSKPRFSSLGWNSKAQKYYPKAGNAGAGRFLTAKAVRDAIEADIAAQQQAATGLGEALKAAGVRYEAGEMSKQEWRQAVADFRRGAYEAVRDTHLNYASAAVGGHAEMGPEQFGRVGGLLRFHIEKLDNFAQEIADNPALLRGDVKGKMDFNRRLDMYFTTALFTFERERVASHQKNGYTRRRNVPHSRDSCRSKNGKIGCYEVTQLGWQPIDDPNYPEEGQRVCGPEGLCTSEFDKGDVTRCEVPNWNALGGLFYEHGGF